MMKTVKLNNGVDVPILGFGVFQIEPEHTAQAVKDAIKQVTVISIQRKAI